jgi:hypothetical protein
MYFCGVFNENLDGYLVMRLLKFIEILLSLHIIIKEKKK